MLPPLSGTSERLAMRPRCDPTVRTAPHPNPGEGSSLWYSQPHCEHQGDGLLGWVRFTTDTHI